MEYYNTQDQLNNYFAKTWIPSSESWEKSGLTLLNKIPKQAKIIDVGCGYNIFKKYFPNLIGIDPANSNADILTTIENYQTDQKFDVALCLGSLHFGTREKVKSQIDKLNVLLKNKSSIYWRCNPGHHDHDDNECLSLKFFPWSFEIMEKWSNQYKFNIKEMCIEKHALYDRERIYAHWERK